MCSNGTLGRLLQRNFIRSLLLISTDRDLLLEYCTSESMRFVIDLLRAVASIADTTMVHDNIPAVPALSAVLAVHVKLLPHQLEIFQKGRQDSRLTCRVHSKL